MRYVGVRGLNNFQSFLTLRKVPSMIRLYREDESYRVRPALRVSLAVILPAAQKMWLKKLRQKEEEAQSLGDIQDGRRSRESCKKKAQRQRRRRDETEMERGEDAVVRRGTRLVFSTSHFSSKNPLKSSRVGLDCRNRGLNVRKTFAYTPSVKGAPCFSAFSGGVGKRSSGALPPVGGAQQSQVAVGGTGALLRRRRRRLGSSQHLCVLKQVGKKEGSGQVKSVFYCTSGY